jgi:hypothetical protein
MAYTLDEFCADTRAVLKSKPLADALPRIAEHLSRLLGNAAFVDEAFKGNMEPSKRELYHDAELDFYVLAHVQPGGKAGKPHSHGNSWAVYGNARAQTDMTEWRRVNPQSDDHLELVASSKYSLTPGQTRAYGPGVMHSTAHPQTAWVIRVTGTDLDRMPRYQFSKKDKILESA